MKKVNPVIQWWVTPKLPVQDIFELPLLMNKGLFGKITHLISQWLIHPLKRRLARRYLKALQRFTDIKVIGVTGSAGKSTTVQMIASILRQSGRVVATPPSIDPIYNVPNTILKCLPGTKFLILEMSVEYPGEMDYYLWLATPGVGVITNIFPTHTEFLGGIEGVLKEKAKLVLNLSKDGVAVLNEEDLRLRSLKNKIKTKIVWFNGENSDTARVVGEIFGVSASDIERGLKNYTRPKHRLETILLKSGAVVLDDSYNSNPEALLATLRKFNGLAGNNIKIAVLGDMLELGKLEESEHRRVGKEIAGSNFDVVIGVGKAVRFLLAEVEKGSKKTKTYLFPRAEDVLPALEPALKKRVYVLIKGSRSVGLDKVVAELV